MIGSKPHNALVERSRREDHGGPFNRKPVEVSDDEDAYDREFKRMIIIRKFETDDVKGLEAYARSKHPDAVTISFDRANKLIRVVKATGQVVTLA